ncbi:MAG: tRNA pseudouridine(55) synthase TruB [Clostridiaceae bacterium]|nr:tRNA pseudouridine(55) synthase TruB [Clostridiaceae bacterium]
MSISGLLNIYKPIDWTSFDVVKKLRSLYQIKKVGHAGTLDPFAEGVLPVAFGQATKWIPYVQRGSKEYIALIYCGIATDTADIAGREITEKREFSPEEIATFSYDDFAPVRDLLAERIGSVSQVPPMFSARKHQGQRLYDLARRGVEVERQAKEITVEAGELLAASFVEWSESVTEPVPSEAAGFAHLQGIWKEYFRRPLPQPISPGKYLVLLVRWSVSTGTYVRVLASDLGADLGTNAYCAALLRSSYGSQHYTAASTLTALPTDVAELFASGLLLSADEALADFPPLYVDAQELQKLYWGQSFPIAPERLDGDIASPYRAVNRPPDAPRVTHGIVNIVYTEGRPWVKAERMFPV